MAGFYGISNHGYHGSGRSRFSGRKSLSPFSSVRKKSYAKARKAYLGRYSNLSADTQSKSTGSTSAGAGAAGSGRSLNSGETKIRSEREALSKVNTGATGLVNAADKLTRTSRSSVLYGDSYDREAAYDAVSDFVSNYNDTVNMLRHVENSSVVTSGNSLTRMTGLMSKALSKVGVDVSADGKLSVDKERFKNADTESVRELFYGSGSYAATISSSASRLASQAGVQARMTYMSSYAKNGYYKDDSENSYYNAYF